MSGSERLHALIERGRVRNASDLHVESGQGAAFRIFSNVERIVDVRPEVEEIEAFLDLTVDRVSRARLDTIGIADAVYIDDRVGAIRIHASRGRLGPRLAIRFLARAIPNLEDLRLPAMIESFASLRSGLVLVVGPTGSGKTTTIASLLDRINATSTKHILTFEDPIEYQHRWSKSIVTQYEVGRDISNFAEGIRGSLRADPDVLFIGELRGIDTVSATLQAAESGHVVFAALHTPSETPHAVNRIVGLFQSDEQESVRARLAETLRAIVGLRLLPLADGSGLRPAAEIMIANDAVRRLIRDGATHQLRSTIASARREGLQTLESHLSELVACGDVDIAAARAASLYPDEIRELAAAHVRRR